ncbi:MAG TPA: PilZ domain-containing protein [Caulobacteraceae bacterium]|nr:PilZ domain-containing protein [Caulobacteraceae bacterium]
MRHSPETTAAADRRDSERTPTTLRGKVFPGALDCVVSDFSKGGARLRFSGPPPAEDRIVVVIWSTGAAAEAVRCWRGDVEAGWRFLNRFDLRAAVPKRLAEVKAQWLGRRRQLRRRELAESGAMIGYRGSPSIVRLS